MAEFKIKCSLKGLRNSIFWRKNLSGFFEHNGKDLTDAQVRALVEFGISKGYETEEEFTEQEIEKILNDGNK